MRTWLFAAVGMLMFFLGCLPTPVYALSSANVPLSSPIYSYLEKLAGYASLL